MRERRLMADGWRILRIKSNHSLPNREQVDLAIAQLLADRNRVEIILDDWGDGPTRYDKA